MEPHLLSLEQIVQALDAKTLSAEELTSWMLERIERFNGGLHAYIRISDAVLEEAREVDRRRAKGLPLGPLAGVPFAIKDLIDTAEMQTTYGGLHFRHRQPEHDAAAWARLKEAGALLIGKTNLHEYAFGTTNENPHFGNAVNPWNRAKITGGSSGGSSAALVAGLCTAALGTDTGGSIRIPAALTGHVGLKPTFDAVDKSGVFPLADSLDHVGPMTKTVRDAAHLFRILAGNPAEPFFVEDLQTTLPKAIRIGVPKHFFFEKCHPYVLQVVRQAIHGISGEAEFSEVDIEYIDEVPEHQSVIISSEAHYVHRKLLAKNPDLYGEDVRQRLEAAGNIPASSYIAGQQFRTMFKNTLGTVFENIDVLVTPTTPLVATDIGQTKAHIRALEVPVRSQLTRFTNPWNFSGYPAISIPCGLSPDGLPVGLQVVSTPFSEFKLLAIAAWLEDRLPWNAIAPDFR